LFLFFFVKQVPLSERLNAFELNGSSGGEQNSATLSQIPTADSLVTLLSQGLQSSDKTILEVICFCF